MAQGAIPIEELAEGPPSILQRGIPSSTFDNFAVAHLAKPKLLWINRDWLREHNFETPAEITPDFEKRFLDAVAWVVKDGNKIPEGMVDERTRMASADFYGGHGIGYHKGSARAISLGRIQNKGSFRNSMFEDPLSSSEKDGTAGLHE